MRRRTLLAAVGAGTLSLAGCLSNAADGDTETPPTESPTSTRTPTPTEPPGETPTDSGGRRYEECSREVIPYGQFPADVRTEIDAALDGRYEADRVYLREAMDVEASYVSVDDAYYDPAVTVADGRETLELRRVEPKVLPNPRPVRVEHHRDGERTISVEVVAEDGTVLVDRTRDLWPGGDVEFGRTRRVGTHGLRVTVADGDEVEDETTDAVRIDESHFDVLVVVEEDTVELTGTVADLGICRYHGAD